MSALPIDAIEIGERIRKDMGDLNAFAADIKRNGLLHPIGVKPNHGLIFGHRRLEAAKLLGWKEIEVTVHDLEDYLSAEQSENKQRKNLAPTEAVALGRLIEEQHKAKIWAQQSASAQKAAYAREVKAGRIDLSKKQVDYPKALGNSRDVAARAVGMSSSNYQVAKDIVTAAESDPDRFGDLPSQMDETGNVRGTHRELQHRKGNGKKPRHAALRKLHYPKPNREMQRAVDSLGGICICLKEMPVKQLDTSKTRAWAVALKKAASTITRAAREVERVKSN